MILSKFAEVDGDLTPAQEAERNNQRDETERWAAKLRESSKRWPRSESVEFSVELMGIEPTTPCL